MSAVEVVLLEELERSKNIIISYREMLNKLPRGTIYIRKMGNSSFAYRKRKESNRVISEYLGNINDDLVKQEIEKSKEYKRIKNNIRIASLEYEKLRKACNIYERKRKTY